MITWIVGLSAAGKTTLGKIVYDMWKKEEPNTVFIDGDIVRSLFDNPGYTVEARRKNADFICKLCKWLDGQNINVVCCILSIFEESRQWNRKNYSKYFEIYVKVPMTVLRKRDKKGLYASKVKNIVGVDIPFNCPRNSDYVFDNSIDNVDFQRVAKDIFSEMQKNV